MRLHRKRWLLAAVLAGALVLAACAEDDNDVPEEVNGNGNGEATVELSGEDNRFVPADLNVPSGQVTVEFTNNGSAPHTFTSDELGFDTGVVEGGGSAQVTFDAPDSETQFVCTIHGGAGMTGRIVPEG